MSFLGVLDRLDGRYDGRVFGMKVPGYTGKFNAYQQGYAHASGFGGYGPVSHPGSRSFSGTINSFAPAHTGGWGGMGMHHGGFGSFGGPMMHHGGFGSFGGAPMYGGGYGSFY